MKKRLKIDGFLVFCIFGLLVGAENIFLRNNQGGYISNILMNTFGMVLFILGEIIRISARGYKSEHLGNGQALIKTGPYFFVRNPMYLGILLIALGVALILLKWWAAGFFTALFIIRYKFVISQEEKKLEKIFSQEYMDYKNEVPRMLPSIKIFAVKYISECLPLKISWVKKEIGAINTLLLVMFFLSIWPRIKRTGISFYSEELTEWAILTSCFICMIFYFCRQTKKTMKNGSSQIKNTL
ncbi:MAG: isoprenylcysteine carboxylmethyltransferase family protein [Candidatus Omnitrophota bacterium]